VQAVPRTQYDAETREMEARSSEAINDTKRNDKYRFVAPATQPTPSRAVEFDELAASAANGELVDQATNMVFVPEGWCVAPQPPAPRVFEELNLKRQRFDRETAVIFNVRRPPARADPGRCPTRS